MRLEVKQNTKKITLQEHIMHFTHEDSTCYTDEWQGYNAIHTTGRVHQVVCPSKKEWARDENKDGVREVHTNTCEGIWTGLRNFLRIFRGVHKKYLHLYCAIFEIKHNYKSVCPSVVQACLFRGRVLTR